MRGRPGIVAAIVAAAAACRPSTAPPAGRPAPPVVPVVRAAAGASRPAVGDAVVVHVVVSGAPEVFAVPFHLTFDPAVLRFVSAEEGPWLHSDGQPTTFLSALAAPGRLIVGASRLGPVGGVAGGGEVCVLRFSAVGKGDAKLAFEKNALLDPKGDEIRSSFEAAPLGVR